MTFFCQLLFDFLLKQALVHIYLEQNSMGLVILLKQNWFHFSILIILQVCNEAHESYNRIELPFES